MTILPPQYPGSSGQSGTCAGTHYSAQSGGPQVAVTCTPTASASGNAITNSASVAYTATATAVAIQLTGPIQDSSGSWDILVGQHCGVKLGGVPSGTGWTATYQWSVSGTTFQTWSPTTPQIGTTPANSQASYYDPGPGPLTNLTAGWYWNDPSPAAETISCTANVTPPSGQGQPFTVTATQQVMVMVPTSAVNALGGIGRINNTNAALQNKGAGYYLYAGSTTAGMQDSGDIWAGSVTEPSPFGGGQWAYLQIVTPSATNDPNNGMTGLDGKFPYSGTYSANGTNFAAGDSPGEMLLNSYANMTIADTFQVYVMYAPSGGTWVPLRKMTWSFNANDARPSSGNWADYTPADAAGTVMNGTFTPQSTFPSWTRINN